MLPAISAQEVEEMLARVAKQKKKAPTKNQQKLQKMARVGSLLKMGTQAMMDPETESDEEDKREISVTKAQEYQELFRLVTKGTGQMDEIAFHDAVGEVMNFDERKKFYDKYVKRLRLKKNQQTTRMGMLSGQYKADYETFLTMMLPRGYKMPTLPDPDRHCCSHDELVNYHFVTGQKMAGRRLKCERVYAVREVHETRSLKQHEAIPEQEP